MSNKNCGKKKALHNLRKLGDKFPKYAAVSVLSNLGCINPEAKFETLIKEHWIHKNPDGTYRA